MKPLPCPPARWPDFSRLLDAALALPAGQRAVWLAALQGDDATLREHLAPVLAAAEHAADDTFMRAPRLPAGAADDDLPAGTRIGPWRLLRPLGRGGMGVVWLAERADGAYAREVALKLPHAHLLAGDLRRRFARERDILAGLSHPHIAAFYDAGLADDGRPYLALEAVQGLPITRWAREQRLGLAPRLDLMAQVMAAVEHAHGKFIAHRDLKPANVLVGADGQARLLDFGIAKLLDAADDDGAEPLTRAGQRPATPGYAAPEQLAGGPITVATDVYALGAMLFELLAGRPPGAAGDAARPSADADAAQAEAMGLALPALRRALHGDLDAIVAQAMQADATQRYPSVAALAADLQRHRRGEPIVARRISAVQRAAKFVRRHRAATSLSALLAASVLAGVAGVAWQAQEARVQARRAEAVKDFLLGVFKASDPRTASDTPRGQLTAKALLDASAGRIEARFEGDPELQIELLRTTAEIYGALGEETTYQTLHARQLERAERRLGPLHPQVLASRLDALEHSARRNDLARCREQLDTLDPLLRRAGLDEDTLRARWWTQRSACLADRPQAQAEREQAIARALALLTRTAPESRWRVAALAEQAGLDSYAMRHREAVAANREAIALAERLPERDDTELLTLHANTATSLQQLGDLEAAEAGFARAAELALRTTGPQSRAAWLPASRRARTAHLAGARERADRLFQEVLAVLPPREAADAEAQTVREHWGERLSAEGRPLEAIPVLEAVEQAWITRSPSDFALRRVRRHLGEAYARAGRSDDAQRVLQLSLDDYERRGNPRSQPVIAIRESLGRFLLDRGDAAAARRHLERAVRDAGDPDWSTVALAQAGLARVALATGDGAAAEAASRQALAIWDRVTGFKDMRMQPYLWRVRAAVLAAQGDAPGAAALRTQALAASRRYDAPESPSTRDPSYLGL